MKYWVYREERSGRKSYGYRDYNEALANALEWSYFLKVVELHDDSGNVLMSLSCGH